jgi:3-hydroxymyristoyl/3-hydroxydecanoyl-(acyl carrier protein) dehydratase
MSEWQEQAFTIPANHPSAAGHFPGNPIVPGALLLDAVVEAVAGAQTDVAIRGAKFLRPVRHGTALTMRWQAVGGLVRFECFAPEGLVLSGTLTVNTLA